LLIVHKFPLPGSIHDTFLENRIGSKIGGQIVKQNTIASNE
jgi:hypothetical protein